MGRKKKRANNNSSPGTANASPPPRYYGKEPPPKVNSSTRVRDAGGNYALCGGSADVNDFWKSLNDDEKREIVWLDSDYLAEDMSRLTHVFVTGLPTPELIQHVQANFILAMENFDGSYLIPDGVSLGYVGLIAVLEDRLQLEYNKHCVHRRSFWVLVWIATNSSWWWLALYVLAAVYTGKMDGLPTIRKVFCTVVEYPFVHTPCSCCVQWRSECCLAGSLLMVLLAIDVVPVAREIFFCTAVGVAVPFMLGALEDHSQLQVSAETSGLSTFRGWMSLLIQLVLLFLAWQRDYMSFIMVNMIFFSGVSKYAFALLVYGVGYAASLVISLISLMVPIDTQAALVIWYYKPPGYHRVIVHILGVVVLLSLLWYLWEDEGWTGSICRPLLALLAFRAAPDETLSGMLGLSAILVALPLAGIQKVIDMVTGKKRDDEEEEEQ